jgi:hypothetical protein
MNDVMAATLANIELELAKRQLSRSEGRASLRLIVPGSEEVAKALALRGYKTALLLDGRGYRIYAKESK